MIPSTPASPTLPPPPSPPLSPGSPHSPGTSLTQQQAASNDFNRPICRRNSLTTPVTSPTHPRILTPLSPTHEIQTPKTAYFRSIREDGRQNRMAMRSPRITLPLRVRTGTTMSSNSNDSSGGTSTNVISDLPRPMASINENEAQSPFSNTTTLLNWSPPPSATPIMLQHTTNSSKRLMRPHVPSPISASTSNSRPTHSLSRSPIRKKARFRVPPPPKYHVVVRKSGSNPLSPTTLRNRIQYMHSVDHLRAPLVPLISVSSGLAHPTFPKTLLQYHLLTHDQLDDLARWYHQVEPPVDETFMYPAWIPAWTNLDPEASTNNVIFGNAGSAPTATNADLETKRRRFGRFIGLQGCQSPTMTGPEGERPDELARRMEREWRRALERAAEEDRAWEKGWRGRW